MISSINENLQSISLKKYEALYHEKPLYTIFAPGRINLIGEHTDYSDGFVMPVAIDLGVFIAMSPTGDDQISLYSIDFSDFTQVSLTQVIKGDGDWKEFLRGIIWALNQWEYTLSGWQGVIVGNLPIGAGLSSSAAVEIALIRACMVAGNHKISPTDMARIGRKAEQDWVGVNVGIMDQLISAAGLRGHAVLLDCRSLTIEYIPMPASIQMVVLDTKTRRELTHSAYNTRQEEVKTAARILNVPSLRDASLTLLNELSEDLSPTIYKRACHVISENQRVKDFGMAMKQSHITKMGTLLNESHASLRDDFEVSSIELNTIVEIAQEQPECIGARMTGAGFGGCALALISSENNQRFKKSVFNRYHKATSIQPEIFTVSSSDGAQLISP